ncbi:hypothetical protein ACFQNE_17155 [Gordonia phosphorivorans]|uniref:Uncharacterized protein n=1 Tax=Gordonia phosphorivorans TaxID=1056982 RepID=A0ABV6HA01_9ACTN
MTAVEINAGAWYLRALRHDDRLSDVPALADLGLPDPAGYVAGTSAVAAPVDDAAADAAPDAAVRCVWAVAEPTTGELVALVGVAGVPDGEAALRGLARTDFAHALTESVPVVRRYAEQALGLRPGELIAEPP